MTSNLPPKHARNANSHPERTLVHLPLMKRAMLNPICREYLMHIANERKASIHYGRLLKMLGVKAGVSDLFLAYPSKVYHGYWIELKAPGNKPTDKQLEFMHKMRKVGYASNWFDDWEKAWKSIEDYLADKS